MSYSLQPFPRTLVNCSDCQRHSDAGMSAFCCPLFRQPRDPSPRECVSFRPTRAATMAAQALAAALRSHTAQRARYGFYDPRRDEQEANAHEGWCAQRGIDP